MKRSGRLKFLKIAVFFLVYSTITVWSKNLKLNNSLNLHTNLDLDTFTKNETKILSNVLPSIKHSLPNKSNCTPPAIEQFPKPFMSQWTRTHGGIVVHILIALYSFLALAIVCDDYFVASLERICEDLNLEPDVAGATFMAAGSSSPELATVVIGVFVAKDDIGTSSVIGSAVFNIVFVISVSALATTTACYLDWWPLVRDSFFYALSILAMLYTIQDECVTWSESLLMLFMYVMYCTFLCFNPQFKRWVEALTGSTGSQAFELADDKTSIENNKRLLIDGCGSISTINVNRIGEEESPLLDHDILNEDKQSIMNGSIPNDNVRSKNEHNITTHGVPSRQQEPTLSLCAFILWAIMSPIHFISKVTIPNCRIDECKKWYPLTFIVSILWIGLYSYLMVWMITVIGTTFGIPDTVMGLTFVAAGVSIPDALVSVAVIKEGHGNMAVSNAIGSNVFDILLCLGLPWFIQTAIVAPGSHVNVTSKGLTYSTVTLFTTVIFLIVATHLNGWKLDKKFGVILMIWYFFFIILASLYELNVFGQFNPPECLSLY